MPSRLLLDTNVWRAVIDADSIDGLRCIVKSSQARILIAPGVVYEMLRTPDAALRRRQLKAVTLGTWDRMMTEVFDEANDIVEVIRRRRPEWLREDPDRSSR